MSSPCWAQPLCVFHLPVSMDPQPDSLLSVAACVPAHPLPHCLSPRKTPWTGGRDEGQAVVTGPVPRRTPAQLLFQPLLLRQNLGEKISGRVFLRLGERKGEFVASRNAAGNASN